MSETFLNTIYDAKRRRVATAKQQVDIEALKREARHTRSATLPHRFRSSMQNDGVNIIAEIKRASPSKGVINDQIDVGKTAANYQAGGAAAISVLTEEDFFQGSLDDLRQVGASAALPILRKDFIFDPFQIYEAAAAGADAILLIIAMLNDADLEHLFRIAETEVGIDALVEVHNKSEFDRAAAIGATLIGVNNRDLHSFDVSLDVSRELIRGKSTGTVMIAESGISTRDEIVKLHSLGFDGFLIGETLMRSADSENMLKELTGNDKG